MKLTKHNQTAANKGISSGIAIHSTLTYVTKTVRVYLRVAETTSTNAILDNR